MGDVSSLYEKIEYKCIKHNLLFQVHVTPASLITTFLDEGISFFKRSVISTAAILDARNRGYKVGILQSSNVGFNVYKRMEFKRVGTLKVYIYTRE